MSKMCEITLQFCGFVLEGKYVFKNGPSDKLYKLYHRQAKTPSLIGRGLSGMGLHLKACVWPRALPLPSAWLLPHYCN